jgi:hypothetical protein
VDIDRAAEGAKRFLPYSETPRCVGIIRFCGHPRQHHRADVAQMDAGTIVDDQQVPVPAPPPHGDAKLARAEVVGILKDFIQPLERPRAK